MGVAPFVMVLSDSVGAAALWNVLYTLGEVLWSPRTATLAAQIAPQGMEATFFSLAAAPQFAAKWPTGLFSGWLLDTFVPQCNRCMDNSGFYCDQQPTTFAGGESGDSFYTTAFASRGLSASHEQCLSRFECAPGTNATLNGQNYACACGATVKPEQPADWCRTTCLSLDTVSDLTTPGKCPTTCWVSPFPLHLQLNSIQACARL